MITHITPSKSRRRNGAALRSTRPTRAGGGGGGGGGGCDAGHGTAGKHLVGDDTVRIGPIGGRYELMRVV